MLSPEQRLRSGMLAAMNLSEAGYHVRQGLGHSPAIHFRHTAMKGISDDVQAAYQAVRRRRDEGGGILLGTRTVRNGTDVIVVEGAEPVHCDHEAGAAFVLSETDREKLTAQLNRIKAEGLVVVGYYRSDTRERTQDTGLDAQDRQLLEADTAAGASIFLLIRPLSASRILADLFVWQKGRLTKEGELMPFPFVDQAPAVAGDYSGTLAAAPAAPAAAMPRVQRRFAWTWLWVVLFGIAGAAVGYKVVTTLANESAQTGGQPAPLDLTAERVKSGLVLRWDPESRYLRNTRQASLLIQDGNRETRYALDQKQVLGGSLTYAPVTGTITFLLDTQNGGGNARAVLTVIDPSR